MKLVLRLNLCHMVIVRIGIQSQDLYSAVSDCAAAESGVDPVPFKTTMGVKHVRVVYHNVSGQGGGRVEVCATVRRIWMAKAGIRGVN